MLIVVALLVLSVLVLVHEFGHFFAAKISGVWVEEFGIGLPPRVWGKKIGDTIYSINALPFGGFVRLHGETSDQEVNKPEKSFLNKSAPARIFIALAGIMMNFVLAILAFTIIFYFTGLLRGVEIVEIVPDSPAAKAGLEAGDQILKVGTKKIGNPDYFGEIIAGNIGKTVNFEVNHGGTEKTFEITLRDSYDENQGALGVVYRPAEIYYAPWWQSPFIYSYEAILKTYDYSERIFVGFGIIFGQLFGGHVPEGVAGPVGVTAIVAEVTKLGILPLLEFMGIISINLALLNLLPFPALDGSRVMFVTLESIIGKKMVEKIESRAHTIGMSILLILLLLLTISEVPKLLSASSLENFVDTIIQ